MDPMTDSKVLARPPQVTMAGWVTIVGSVMVVLTMYDAVANLHTLETQERISEMLDEPPMRGTGLAVDEWLEVMRAAFLLGAACAAAAGILGWFVMQRSHASRVALSVVAVPLFVSGLFTGAFTTSLIAVSAALLWTKPARDWFNGIAPPPASPTRSPGESAPPPPAAYPPPPADPHAGPPQAGPPQAGPPQAGPPQAGSPQAGSPQAGSPQAGPPQAGLPQAGPPPGWSPPGWSPPGWPQPGIPHHGFGTPMAAQLRPQARPNSVLYACLATWVSAGLVGALTALVFLVFALDPNMVATMREQDANVAELGLTDSELHTTALIGLGLMALWSGVAVLLAVLAYRRHGWARTCLIVSAGISVVFALTGAQLVVPLLPAAAAVSAAYFLLRPDAREWYRSKP
jgi:hypothetical protein